MKNWNPFIKYLHYNICNECAFYRFSKDLNNKSGICVKFGKKNIINGKIFFYNALETRKKICGLKAKYFEANTFNKDNAN